MRILRFRAQALVATLMVSVVCALGCGGEVPKLNLDDSSAPSSAPSSVPRPIAFDPPNGAVGVDPERTTLAVTFDRQMDPQGWAWVIEGAMTAPELGDSSWDAETRTNSTQAKLEPGREYVLWINSPQYLYFKDRTGTPAEPTRWTFSTRGDSTATGAPETPIGTPRSRPSGPPLVVLLEPPNGATDVDPATTLLRVTFDRPMAEGWSWVIDTGAPFPETTGPATMSPDRRQAMLPVRLDPATTYAVWLNGGQHRDFADTNGVTLSPLKWSFTTASDR